MVHIPQDVEIKKKKFLEKVWLGVVRVVTPDLITSIINPQMNDYGQ